MPVCQKKEKTMKNPSADRPFIRPAVDAVPLVEPGALSRFEGEGGPAAPILERVDVPLATADVAGEKVRDARQRLAATLDSGKNILGF